MSNIPNPQQTPSGPVFEGRPLVRPDDEVVDQGARFDMDTLLTRRRMLAVVGIGAGSLALAACTGGASGARSSSRSTPSASDTAAGEIPQETNGPYPADGTNGVNVLEDSGIVRQDITSSLDGGKTVAGVPLAMSFTLTDMANDDAPFEGAAVYLWQCDAQGLYSMYSEGVEDETYLRGIQVADADGKVTFTTIVPGCYRGRWTHIHFEVYPDVKSATNAENAIATSQVAFEEMMLSAVYALTEYEGAAQNLAQITLETDNVFSDGVELQMGTFTGDVKSGYVGSLTVAIDTRTEARVGGGGPGGGPGGGGPGGGGPGGGGPGGGGPGGAPPGP